MLGREAWTILGDEVVQVARSTLFYAALDKAHCRAHVESVEDQAALRDSLSSLGMCTATTQSLYNYAWAGRGELVCGFFHYDVQPFPNA